MFKKLLKRFFLPTGTRPCIIRGGVLQGWWMYLDLHVDTQVWRGIYEISFQDWLKTKVSASSVCLDIGAAEGWATLAMARLAYNGCVVAVEPSERGEWIEKNVDLNHSVAKGRVHFIKAYLGERTASGGPIRFVKVDDLVSELRLPVVNILKIDVDGPEMEVLAGAIQTIDRFSPEICVEIHSEGNLFAAQSFLEANGYNHNTVFPPLYEYRPIPFNPMIMASKSAN